MRSSYITLSVGSRVNLTDTAENKKITYYIMFMMPWKAWQTGTLFEIISLLIIGPQVLFMSSCKRATEQWPVASDKQFTSFIFFVRTRSTCVVSVATGVHTHWWWQLATSHTGDHWPLVGHDQLCLGRELTVPLNSHRWLWSVTHLCRASVIHVA